MKSPSGRPWKAGGRCNGRLHENSIGDSSAGLRGVGTGTARVPLGVFEAHGDVGETPKQGSVEYDAATGEYRVTGGGANIWSTTDAFHFVWIKVSGDVTIAADIQFIGAGAVAHRKAVLMIRQGLEPGAPYADAALHGDGLTSLQFRTERDQETQEVKAAVTAPQRIRIERHAERRSRCTREIRARAKAIRQRHRRASGPRLRGHRSLLARCRSSGDSRVLERENRAGAVSLK